MKIHLLKAIFINRAPFDKLELDFYENEISVLSAVNGKGKTTIISHIVDAFHEIARPHFQNEYEGKENKFYRVSSDINNLDRSKSSFVYLRFKFKLDKETFDYLDIRNNCTEEEYNKAISIDDKIPFNQIKSNLQTENYIKKVSSNINKEKVEKIFRNNLITYFPAYRYEQPGYLNDPYKIKLNFKKESGFSGYLPNPIEVLSGLPQLANWIMDIVLDMQYSDSNIRVLKNNLDKIVTQSLLSKKYGELRFGVGPRGFGSTRIQIVKQQGGESIYPTIFNLSSGEASLLCIFGELLRQADTIKNNIPLDKITGIVLIDEVDKHLHIKLQKEVLPKLLALFPNVQFIVSSHSPFLSMGLAEELKDRSKVIDLDNLGISTDPTTNDLYKEVYDMMVGENDRFKERYELLEAKIKEGSNPLIVTEGKTDIQHIKKAKEKLNITDLDVDFHEISEDRGDSKLKLLLEQLSEVPQSRKIIGIFDRDVKKIIDDIEKNGQSFKDYGNDVFAFCIPIPKERETYKNISIEFYYTDSELKTEYKGKRLYFDNEVVFHQSASNNRDRKLTKLDNPKTEEESTKKIFDENIGNLNWIHSKARFAELVEKNDNFISDFNFDNFNLIFDKIKKIINS